MSFDPSLIKDLKKYRESASFFSDYRRLIVLVEYALMKKTGDQIVESYNSSGLGLSRKVVYEAIGKSKRLKLVDENKDLTPNGSLALYRIAPLIAKLSDNVDDKMVAAVPMLIREFGKEGTKEFLIKVGRTDLAELI